MSECREIELRELLPEYLHGRLSASVRATVEAHLPACAECREELELLRSVRMALGAEPMVNVGAIVRALPRPRTRWASRNGSLLRIAAAISFVSLGGVSLVVARSAFRGVDSTRRDSAQVVAKDRDSSPSISLGTSRTLSDVAGISELGDDDLEALIGALDKFESAPPAEPDAGLAGPASGSSPR